MCVPYILNASRFEFGRSIKLKVRARRSLGCFFSTSPGEKATRTNVGGCSLPLQERGRSVVCWIAIAMEELHCIYRNDGINTTLIKNL